MRTTELSIDLKWSLWATDRATFEDYGALDAYKTLYNFHQEVMNNDTMHYAVEIHTSPHKEIMGGRVVLEEEGISVRFSTEWDEWEECAPSFLRSVMETELTEEQEKYIVNEVDPFEWFGFWGIEIERDIEWKDAQAFEQMMEAIDKVEDDLLKEDKEAWAQVEEYLKDMATNFDEQNKEQEA